jgi:hypothetical protein
MPVMERLTSRRLGWGGASTERPIRRRAPLLLEGAPRRPVKRAIHPGGDGSALVTAGRTPGLDGGVAVSRRARTGRYMVGAK